MKSSKNKLFKLSLVIALAVAIVGLSSWKSPMPTSGDTDTTKKAQKKESSYSRKTIITFDEKGNPHEETIESFDGDMDWDNNEDFNFSFPPIPDFNIPPMSFHLDSLGLNQFELNEDNFRSWENLDEQMRERFEILGPELEAKLQQLNQQMEKMDHQFEQNFSQSFEQNLLRLEERLQSMGLNDKLNSLDNQLDKLDNWDSDYSTRLKQFEDAALKELVKDGYLKEGDKIESINWSDDEIEFNGNLIKKEHLQKYRELKEKYIRNSWRPGRIE